MKLFISDLDGTLLKIGNEYSAGISEENKQAILSFVKDGNIFAIASARGLDYLDEIEPILGFYPDFIAQNGTAMKYGEHQTSQFIDMALFEELKDFVEKQDLRVSVTLHAKPKSFIVNRKYYPYNTKEAVHDRTFMDSFHELMPHNIAQYQISGIAVFVEPERLETVRDTLKQHFKGRLEVVSSDVDLINISPFGCTKGNGIKKLIEHYGLDIEDVAVIGDSDNDISMFQAVKHSYCMDHSDALIKAQAETVVKSVAEALKHFTH